MAKTKTSEVTLVFTIMLNLITAVSKQSEHAVFVDCTGGFPHIEQIRPVNLIGGDLS